MNKIFITAALAIVGFAASSSASVTLQFSQTGVARASGFSNTAGVPTNGMKWGIIVDASGNGFADGNYNVFDNAANGFLSALGANAAIAADDFFVTTGLSTNSATATGSDQAVAAGAITQLTGIFASYPAGVSAGDPFKIVWFETTPGAGSKYGTFSDPSFVLPSDGFTTSFASLFVGDSDAIKPTSLVFGTPEPSRLMLLGLGGLGLVFRRRRY